MRLSDDRHPPAMHHDFDAAVHSPFRMQPGLRRLPEGAAQLTPCEPDSRHLREKLAVLMTVPGRALVQRDRAPETNPIWISQTVRPIPAA